MAHNSFKPEPLRFVHKCGTEKRANFASTTQFGLTQALGRHSTHEVCLQENSCPISECSMALVW